MSLIVYYYKQSVKKEPHKGEGPQKYQAYFQINPTTNLMKTYKILLLIAVYLFQTTNSIAIHQATVASVVPASQFLYYMNQARTNPAKFAQYVRKEINQFINSNSLPLTPGMTYRTNEGINAWREAQNFLLRQKPLPALQLNEGLSLAAEDHVIDMVVKNFFGHTSSNGKSLTDRITYRCGPAYGYSGENIGSEFKVRGRNHALQTTLGLIIDDGVASRGHRKNIFSENFKFVGIAARVQGNKIVTVSNFHSSNLPSKNAQPNRNSIGLALVYDAPGSSSSAGSSTISSTGQNNSATIPSGTKTVVNTSTSTRSSTVNGVKTTVKTVTTTYSDGSKSVATTTSRAASR